MKNNDLNLIEAAKLAAKKAYAPYSGYQVGAALETTDGVVYTGCNVENASYSLTICAERNAVAQAILNGESNFRAIAIYVDTEILFPPCGACRQVLSEFTPGMLVIYANKNGIKKTKLNKLLPDSFQLKNSKKE